MSRHKVGQSKPDISKEEATLSHDMIGKCFNPYIVNKPLGRMEESKLFSVRFYREDCWQCLNCKWESERIKTRNL